MVRRAQRGLAFSLPFQSSSILISPERSPSGESGVEKGRRSGCVSEGKGDGRLKAVSLFLGELQGGGGGEQTSTREKKMRL